MTDARTNNRLNAGDTFRFAKGTILEHQPQTGETQRRWADAFEEFVVVRAAVTTGGDRMGSYGNNGGWQVWAAPKGTALENLAERMIHFYQDGPYRRDALVAVVLIEPAKKCGYRLTAVSG